MMLQNIDNIRLQIPAKCLLFGEHFVLHGVPAIGIAINLFEEFEYDRECTLSSPIEQTKLLRYMLRGMKIETLGCSRYLRNYGNIGTSAILGIALELISQIKQKQTIPDIHSYEFINRVLYREHRRTRRLTPTDTLAILNRLTVVYPLPEGTPFDKSSQQIRTPCGIFQYHRPNLFFDETHEILLLNDRLTPETSKMIKHVTLWKEANPTQWQMVLNKMLKYGTSIPEIFQTQDIDALQNLMGMAQQVLETINVVPQKSLDTVRKLQKLGYHSAKLTGACGGGAVIALVEADTVDDLYLKKIFPNHDIHLLKCNKQASISARINS